MNVLLVLAVAFPAVLCLGVMHEGRLGRAISAIAPWSALPALVISLHPTGVRSFEVPWLLDGSIWGLDLTGQIFFFFTALLWTVAGVYAMSYLEGDARRSRFFLFHLLSMTGNLGLVAAHDVMTFYFFFALMTFAGYGLIVHTRSDEAIRAGRIYLVMAVIGEALLIIGLILGVAAAGSLAIGDVARAIGIAPERNLIIALILAGFGIKAGALPLHVWLPLAHPVAPTPASAVLSGSMIKAGLLGWLRFLPLGVVALEEWGSIIIALGLLAAFFGVIVGVTQRDAKTTLAYSSISQMGIINVAVGVGLANPAAWPAALAGCLAYAVHHGLAKGALFLGTGLAATVVSARQRWLLSAGLVFAALAIAGAPLTSGAVVKSQMKATGALSPGFWPATLDLLLPLAAVGTTLLMARFLVLVRTEVAHHEQARAGGGMWVPWVILLTAVAAALWILPGHYELEPFVSPVPYAGAIWMSIWPVIAGLLLAWLALFAVRRRRLDADRFHITPGDLLVPLEAVLGRRRWQPEADPAGLAGPVVSLASQWYGFYEGSDRRDRAIRLEIAVTRWRTAALLFALIVVVLLALLALPPWGAR